MRSKFWTIAILFVSCIAQATIQGQAVYFNMTIDLNGAWGSGMTVLAIDSSYYIAGITGPGQNVSIIKVGWTGSEEGWVKKYKKPNEAWYPGNPGSFKPYKSGYIIGGAVVTPDTTYGLLIRFDGAFDSLYTKRYSNFDDYYLSLTNTDICQDSGFIFTGDISHPNWSPDLLIIKSDSLGNELWRSTKNLGGYERGWSIIQMPDSSYRVGGYSYAPGVYHSGNPIVVKFDKNGNALWSKNAGGPYEDNKAMICLDSDSTFTVLTAIADSVCTNDFGYAKITVIKYKQDGTELWRKHYGESICYNSVSNIRLLDNGQYICCGTQSEPGNYEVELFGWLLLLNSEGDSIWFKRYTYFDEHPYRSNRLRDAFPTIDGGFIATGEVNDIPTNPLQRIWVLKVDSLGCDTAGCDPTVGLDEWEIGRLDESERLDLELWPNPARDLIRISLTSQQSTVSSQQSNERWSIEVYDIFGRKLGEKVFSTTRMGGGREGGTAWTVDDGRWMMDVSALPPGLYLLVVKDGATVKASAKFVVAR